MLDLVVHGKANKVIAGDLKLSQRTVEIHRARVMEKMQASSLAHLVRMVLEVGQAESHCEVRSSTRATHHRARECDM